MSELQLANPQLSEPQLDLARRAAKATGWTAPTEKETRRSDSYRSPGGILWVDVADGAAAAEYLPDLDDSATAGCLDARMRERWGEDFEVMPYATNIDCMVGSMTGTIWWGLRRTYAPMPSDDGTGPKRYRSRSHHTLGMESLEDARAMCADLAAQRDADDASAEIAVYDTIDTASFRFTMMMPRQWPC